jgi:hypothetical protein
MHIKNKSLILILALSSMLLVPVSAQTKEVGIYGIWTDQTQYDPGQTITITLELGWDFPTSTDVSPGIIDTITEEYVVEDLYTLNDSGMGNVTLSFTAPSTNGVYEYIVNVFYDEEGWVMSETGYEEHYIYIQVGSTGSGQYSAWVTEVDAPSVLEPSQLFNVTVYVQVSFPEITTFSVAVTDPETAEAIIEIEDQAVGDQTGTYWFEISAPETEGDYTLGADIVFETPQGWTYSDDATQTFDITVSTGGGGGIPGFPLASVLIGSLVALALAYRKPEF